MNLPNKLTLTRIVLVPVFMIFVSLTSLDAVANGTFQPLYYLLAGIVFAAASFTDFLDGHLARKWNMVTDFGKFMDPIADKLLTHTAFIMLTAIGRLNVTACIIFIAREFVVSGLRLCAVEQGHVIAAGMSGKIKTVLQMMLVVVLTITGEGLLPALLTIAASVMTLYSMCEYVWQNRSVLGGAK